MKQFGFLKNDQAVAQNSDTVLNYVDLNQSKGDYINDFDGNTMLDLSGSSDLNPLGYNHDSF